MNNSNMIKREKIYVKSTHWARLAIAANTHLRKALLDILHNTSNDPTVKGVPSSPGNLYTLLQSSKKRILKSGQIKGDQISILFPTSVQSVDSSKFDITLIRFVIRFFCQIKNAKGRFDEPDANDTTLCAYIYRAVGMRNEIYHYGDIEGLDEKIFESLWEEMKTILKGLKYTKDIEPDRTAILDLSKLQYENLKEFRDHLENYKEEMSKRASKEFHIERQFSFKNDKNEDEIVTNIEELIKENDRVIIYGEAGIGKTASARKIKYEWCKGNILNGFNLIYFNSKKINQRIKYPGNAAPLFFSELGDYFKAKGKTGQKLVYYDCVTMPIEKIIIIVDGIDEFPIENTVNENYVNKLEEKILNNEQISAVDTINAIYFGFLFPYSKVCLLGRTLEFERLKKIKVEKEAAILHKDRKVKDCKLLEFNEKNIKDFTCFKICEQKSNGKSTCTKDCQKIYEKIKNINLCKVPTDLKSLIELHKNNLYESTERITRTKLMIATILNRINEHTKQMNYIPCETFGKIRKQKDKNNLLKCIQTLGEISFKTLSKDNVTIKVEEVEDSNGTVYFEDENQIRVERKILENLDFFYVRDCVYHYILEPYHTLNIEFLSACYLFSHPTEWNSISKLNMNRQCVILSFIAGLHTDDSFTEDFVKNVFNTSFYSLERFFSWLYNAGSWVALHAISDIYWSGMMKNEHELSLAFPLLDSISHEVEIPQNFLPETIFCMVDKYSPFEWYKMKYFLHSSLTKVSDMLDMESFLERFPKYNFIIFFYDARLDNHCLNLLEKCKANSRFAFKICRLPAWRQLFLTSDLQLNVDELVIQKNCSSGTINKTLNAISSPTRAIRCNTFMVEDITRFKEIQVKKLFAIFLSGVVESPFSLNIEAVLPSDTARMFTSQQIKILREMESRRTKKSIIAIKMVELDFKHVLNLPNLGNRTLFLDGMTNVNDENLIEFSKHIIPGPYDNLSKYKIIKSNKLYRKKEDLHENEQLMHLHLCKVKFTKVSPEAFASTFSLVPTLVFGDAERGKMVNDDYIPALHWLNLSQKKDCRINELRIWWPQSNNFEHFLNIKSNMIQFILKGENECRKLFNHIMNNSNGHLDKKIKVFVVKYDLCNFDDYEEITLLEKETIEEYKNNCDFDNLRFLDFRQMCNEDEKYSNFWMFCCEITLPFQKNTDQCIKDFSCDNGSFIKETKDESNAIRLMDDIKNERSFCDTESSYDEEIEDLFNAVLETDDSDSECSSSSISSSGSSSLDDLENIDDWNDNKSNNLFWLWLALGIGLGLGIGLKIGLRLKKHWS